MSSMVRTYSQHMLAAALPRQPHRHHHLYQMCNFLSKNATFFLRLNLVFSV
jgi:hypothetical protein